MSLIKYTTEIDADKTAMEISKILSSHGAKAVLTEYDDDFCVTALSFKINTANGTVGFRLPTSWEPVLEVMRSDRKVPRYLIKKEQAIRVSWRIVKAWVEAQMALIELGMVKTEQVFLPYAVGRDGRTLGESFLENPQLLLGE